MRKEYWVVILIILVLGGGYLARHRIKAMLGGVYGTAQGQSENVASNSPLGAGSSASAGGLITMRTDPNKGAYMASANRMTLYIFDRDSTGKSSCYGGCATLWPPYTKGPNVPSSLPANFATTQRTDGSTQYTYKGMPLYYYSPDKQPGDTMGDGVGGVWHLVKP